jgi:prefoldin subunit 5
MAPVGPVAPAVPDEEAELEALKEQAGYFEKNLEGLRRRIQKLEAAPKAE